MGVKDGRAQLDFMISVLADTIEATKMSSMGTRRTQNRQRRSEERAMALRHFVEEMGLHFEYGGIPRMAGRIFGHLLICDPPPQSAEQLAKSIQASRASVSTMTRLLIQVGLVERQVLPGKRHDLFRIHPEAFRTQMMERVRLVKLFRQLLERGLAALEGEPEQSVRRLEEMYQMYSWMEQEIPRLFERYQKDIARRRA
jgi:DNA-binding transcriptional regulator GbsR (MarR family)